MTTDEPDIDPTRAEGTAAFSPNRTTCASVISPSLPRPARSQAWRDQTAEHCAEEARGVGAMLSRLESEIRGRQCSYWRVTYGCVGVGYRLVWGRREFHQ